MYISSKSTVNPYQPGNSHQTGKNAAQRRLSRQNAASEPINEVTAANSVSPDQASNQGQNQQKLTPSRNDAVRQVKRLGEPAKQLNDKRDTSTLDSLALQRRAAQITASYHSSMLTDVAEQVRGQVIRDGASLHAQRAVQAYETQQNFSQRDHITTVLGIDEYA